MTSISSPWGARLLVAASMLASFSSAQAQSFCASDGQPRPVLLTERFINADCSTCWSDPATTRPGVKEIALDWIIPGSQGDDAPLSAVATRDALTRLEALHTDVPLTTLNARHTVKAFEARRCAWPTACRCPITWAHRLSSNRCRQPPVNP